MVNELPGPVGNVQLVKSSRSEASTETGYDFGQWGEDQATQFWGLGEDNLLDRSDNESQDVGTSWLCNLNEFASDMNSGRGSFAGEWSPGMFDQAEINFGHYRPS